MAGVAVAALCAAAVLVVVSAMRHPATATASATMTSTAGRSSGSIDGLSPTVAAEAVATIRDHYTDIADGRYAQAYALTTRHYQKHNRGWVTMHQREQPRLVLLSVRDPIRRGRDVDVAVDFFTRDTFAVPGSDTRCRHFAGVAAVVDQHGEWRYNPDAGEPAGRIELDSDPSCPG